jgi:iron-sulfur cluster repair protein YtfE (RIC family)
VLSMSTSPTQQIRDDHTRVTALFHRLRGDGAGKAPRAIALQICAELEIHATLEEELFYPALREAGVQSPALDKAVPEHDEMRRLIERVRTLGEDAPPALLLDTMNELINGVLHHVADEETQLLPAAERMMPAERLAEVGEAMRKRRLALMAETPFPAKTAAKTAAVALGAVAGGLLVLAGVRRAMHHGHRVV